MRSSLFIAALAVALLQGTHAFSSANLQKFRIMAEMGLNPDGSAMESLTSGDDFSTTSIDAAVDPANETIVEEYVELPVDEFATDGDYAEAGTFYNRFYVREGAYRKGGPVFLYDYGEASTSLATAQSRLLANTSFFKEMVDKYHGIGIVWEHRYYGNSTPGGFVDRDTPPENYKWLTTEQSLADVDRFAKQFTRANINYTLTPDKTPWVFVGGSYPGMRASFMRERYPDTIYAGYASSAPTEAQVDMSVYFEPVVRGLKAYGWGNCTSDIHAAILRIDTLLDDPATAGPLKQKFLGPSADKIDNAVFADALTLIFNYWQSYGVEGGQEGLRFFCDFLETDPQTEELAPAEGWAASRGAEYPISRWAAYRTFQRIVTKYLATPGSNCLASAPPNSTCVLDATTGDPDGLAWRWQYCTQWGYFQSANLGPNQVVSKFNSLAHQRDICHLQWPTAPASLLPEWPAVNKTNAVFGGWSLRPSNVYWSGGEFDPWRTLSPLSSEPWAPHPAKFTTPPACGVAQSAEEIFGYVIENAEHCFDFRVVGAVPGASVSRGYFYEALTEWLKCFKGQEARGVELWDRERMGGPGWRGAGRRWSA